ncbi:hypothetical protein D9756_009387 [Leucocoprinus leucothites]|uniref:F-box domain-containing protein n=1 Tax=Leucocoprinus leucothites TaxID=201217 RepID=A0A8H5FU64_9AGAR|nr:hypothetical protein D9756_009387 [Leucoagaricus leucothites]
MSHPEPVQDGFVAVPDDTIRNISFYLDRKSYLAFSGACSRLRELLLGDFFKHKTIRIDPTDPHTSDRLPHPSILEEYISGVIVKQPDGSIDILHSACNAFLQRLHHLRTVGFHGVNFQSVSQDQSMFRNLSMALRHTSVLAIIEQSTVFPPHILVNCLKIEVLILDLRSITRSVYAPAWNQWLLEPNGEPSRPKDVTLLGNTTGMRRFGEFLETEGRFSFERVRKLKLTYDEYQPGTGNITPRAFSISSTGERRPYVVESPSNSERAGLILRHAGAALVYLELNVRLFDISRYAIPGKDLGGLCNLRYLKVTLTIKAKYFTNMQDPSDPWLLSLMNSLPSNPTLEKLHLHYKILLEKNGGPDDESEALKMLQLFISQELDEHLFGNKKFAGLKQIQLQAGMFRNGRAPLIAQEHDADGFFPSIPEHGLSRSAEVWVAHSPQFKQSQA